MSRCARHDGGADRAALPSCAKCPRISPAIAEKAAVDALIPWLLREDADLRGIPFREVIFDTTGKRVLAFDPKNEVDQRVVGRITAVLNEVMQRLNAPIPRGPENPTDQ